MYNISVIIPTWNQSDTIGEAILSALKQTYPVFEVLVCDDGSTDNTQEVVRRLSQMDSRVRWLGGERAGRPAVPRNRGIVASRGDWVAFLDSDDRWVESKVARQVELAERLGCGAVSSNAYRKIPSEIATNLLLTWQQERICFWDLMKLNLVVCSSAVIRKSLFSTVIGFPESPVLCAIEDYTLWLRVATQTDFAFVNEPLVIYNDDTQRSLRSTVKQDARIQKQRVLADFLAWARSAENLPLFCRFQAKKEYMKIRWRQARCSMLKSNLSMRWIRK